MWIGVIDTPKGILIAILVMSMIKEKLSHVHQAHEGHGP
jgi:hypothetical protein